VSNRSTRDNAIPQKSRLVVRTRAHNRCERCGVGSTRAQWHHRRSRRVRTAHRHCPCNGLWLCPTCHTWVHQNPVEARANGWIVSAHVETPFNITVKSAWGLREQDCHGGTVYL